MFNGKKLESGFEKLAKRAEEIAEEAKRMEGTIIKLFLLDLKLPELIFLDYDKEDF